MLFRGRLWKGELCGLVGALVAVSGSSNASAQAQDGDIFMSEYTAGAVVNLRGGGDKSGDTRFATGLTNPTGLCQGPGDHIYVAESFSPGGQVTIITAGGDFTGAAPFATGLSAPMGLHCTDTQILVTENFSDQVTDITLGGDFGGAPSFARNITLPARHPSRQLRHALGRRLQRRRHGRHGRWQLRGRAILREQRFAR